MRQAIWVRLFDLHCDTPTLSRQPTFSIRQHGGAVDLLRGESFRPWSQCFAAFLPDGTPPHKASRLCDGMLDAVCGWEREDDFRLCRKRADLATDFDGCCALLTVENGGVLGEDLSVIDRLAARGVRVVGLTWNGDNYWGSGCNGSADGLTAIGRQALHRIEELGLVADVSHLNRAGFRQVVQRARRPFMASHSNAAAIHPHRRNLTDEEFCAVRDAGGVVGLNLYAPHLGSKAVFAAFQRHLEHFLSLGGEHTVCIGSDLDGMDVPPSWNGMRILELLWTFLQSRGFSLDLLEDIFYNNACDFFRRTMS